MKTASLTIALRAVALTLFAVSARGLTADGAARAVPNVLFIIADDASCHFGGYGCRWTRTPAGIVRPGRRVVAFTSTIDLAPTLLELYGVDGGAAGMRPMTGRSLVDLLRDAAVHDRDTVFLGRERNDAHCRPGTESGLGYPARALRRGSLFYVHNFAPDRWPCGDPDVALADTDAGPTKAAIEAAGREDRHWRLCFGKRPADELYDLATDPDCIVNLATAGDRAADVRRLRDELFAELVRQEDPRMLGRGDEFDGFPSRMPKR